MLNEEQIEDILYRYVRRQDEFNLTVIRIIADRLSRIAEFDELSTMDIVTIMEEDISEIESAQQRYNDDQKKRIHDDFWILVAYLYEEAWEYYTVVHALESNRELMSATREAVAVAQASFAQLTRNPVFVIRDLQNPSALKPYNLEQTYRTIINEAQSYSALSDEFREIALKRTGTQLFDSGVRYLKDNSSNDTVSANSAVRLNMLNSVRHFIDKVQDIIGAQFGADGVELSAHIYPAPDHAPSQGHRFTFDNIDKMQSGSNFEDVDGTDYTGFERQIGTWNCRHYFRKVKLSGKPTYTQKELDKILADNEQGYTAPNGKHYTLYECTQVQRRYERNIRKAKENYLFAKTLGDKLKMMSSRTRVGSLTTQYKQFSRACGIPAKLERIKVKYY